MRKSIFEIENRLDIDREFSNFISCLYEQGSVRYNYSSMSFYKFLSDYVFNLWDYRDTFIDFDSYLEHIGILDAYINGILPIPEDVFLNFLELILNLSELIRIRFVNRNTTFSYNSIRVKGIFEHNIPLILERMNYESYSDRDRIMIRKRDSDVDSILELVPDDIQNLLLEYNDIRNNNVESKQIILKKLDLFIEKDKKKYKGLNASTYDSIQIIVNKMGINHPITEQPYSDLKSDELIKWYDKCFKLMIHLIRIEDINEINADRKKISG